MTDYSEFILKNFYKIEGYRIFFPRRNPTFNNPEFENATLRVLIVRLSPLQNIRESITHHFLFQEIRRDVPLAYIDYAFFPQQKNIQFFKDNNIPFFLGIQSFRPINDFDLVLISNSFTLELFNLPYLFSNIGIPGMKSNRQMLRPIVIMGGSNVLMAQCAISNRGDSFVDALFFGEGEGSVGKISIILNENREKPKREVLVILEKEVKGFFDIRLPIPDSISAASPPHASYILTDYPILNTDIENTVKLQITRGCPCFCSFCFEGHTRKPFREYKPEDIYSKALEAKIKHAPVEFDFLSFNFNLHTGISKIIADLNEIAKFVNFKSQRIDLIAMRPELLDLEMLSGKRNYTFGVEGINDRIRRFLHKSLSEKELLISLEHIYSRKPRQIKLFFIITGLENENDCMEFKDFIMKLKNLKANLSPGCRTIMSLGLLTNLPFTPMQFSQTINPERIKKIKGNIKRDCETNNFEFRMAQDIEDFLICQHIVLAGFECFDVICGFAKKGGYFSGENIIGDKTSLILSLRSASGDRIYDAKDMKYVFPFENVKGTPVKSFLFRMYNEAKNFTDNGYCLEGKGECIGCGGCEEQKRLSLPEVKREDLDRLKNTVEKKKRPGIVRAEVSIKEPGSHLTPEAKCSFIGNAILEQLPALAIDYLACRQVQNMEASKGYGFLFGRFLYDFEFSDSQEVFLSYLKEKIIDSSLLSILFLTEKEIGNDFRIVSQWNDPLEYSFQNHLQKYLLSKGLGFNIKKQEPFICFEVAAKDRKKKILNWVEFQQDRNNVTLVLETGSNFLIIDMLKYLFVDGWMDAKVESI